MRKVTARDNGAEDRAVRDQRLRGGVAAVFTETSCNTKLSPVELVEVGERFKRPRVCAPYCSSTFASIQASCPDSCRFKMQDGRSGGCFADAGFTRMRSRRYDRAAVGMTALEVIAQEARAIRRAFRGGRIPQDGMKGGRDLRLHIGGDAPTAACAKLLGTAASDWRARGGGAAWAKKMGGANLRDDTAIPLCERCHARAHGQKVDGNPPISKAAQAAIVVMMRARYDRERSNTGVVPT